MSYQLGPSTCKRESLAVAVEGKISSEIVIRKPGKEAIPSPRPGEVVVFEAFFEAGLGLLAVDFLSEVLDLFHVTLPQLSPNAIARLAIFEWALRAEGCEGRAEIFAALHRASCQPKTYLGPGGEKIVVAFGSINFWLWDEFALRFPAKAINARWYTDWILRWFYAEVGAGSRLAGPLQDINFRREALVHPDPGQLEARLSLLQRISRRMSMRDLAEEFIALQIPPLMDNWPITFEEDPEGGLRKISSNSSPAAPMTSEQVVRASEKILGVPTPAEKEWRTKLVDLPQEEASVTEGGVKVTVEPASIPDEAVAATPREAPTVDPSVLNFESDEDFGVAFDPPSSPVLTHRQDFGVGFAPMEVAPPEDTVLGPQHLRGQFQKLHRWGLEKQIVLARVAAVSNERGSLRLQGKVTALQRSLNVSEVRVSCLDKMVSAEWRARQNLEAANKKLEEEQIVLRAEVEKMRVEHATAGAEVVKLQEEKAKATEDASNLHSQKSSLATEAARLSAMVDELTSSKDALIEDKVKSEKVAAEVMNNLLGVLEYFGTLWTLRSSDNVPWSDG
ncbi:hypothetical protein GUJ93_ZPchr0004g38983 [Zizania palustris]|uniref:Transposase (putative) gypsy type domain-containing protein n=1 Tax=Zizania palustris TaxID=103762 RepID=A0A8J5S5Z2_ZIZPA|nr:hypothetical protein GUJ93_ZPchr0004g38983 [Zizania palustris]